jgi:hypothetical protein
MILGLRVNSSVLTLTGYRASRNQNWYLEFVLGRNVVFGDFFKKYEKLAELVEVLKERKITKIKE